jgi:endonuclease/exonuclease/phosphatase family metal-dependent hydrolase
MQKKLIYTTLIFMISIFFFGCASSPPKEYKHKPSEKETKEVVQPQASRMPSDVPLTAMTFNIRVGAGTKNIRTIPHKLKDSPKNLEFIAQAIKSVDPDVVGLQEVQGDDQAKSLSKLLNMNYVYKRYGSHPVENWFGVAILSKHRIKTSKNYIIAGWGTAQERTLLECTIDVKGREVTIFAAHIHHKVNREKQFKKILKQISKSNNPVILMGDLNTVPESPEIQPLKESLSDTCEAVTNENSDFVKTNGTAHPKMIQAMGRLIQKLFKTPYHDHFRVDYVFCDKQSFRVIDVGLTNKQYWNASDHLAYFARLELI